jgi:elongator complex protein 2
MASQDFFIIIMLINSSSTTHVDHVYRLAWRPTNEVSSKELATCSEDGTLKILIVHVGVN